MSAGFTVSKGKPFRDELPLQRQISLKVIQEVEQSLAAFENTFPQVGLQREM